MRVSKKEAPDYLSKEDSTDLTKNYHAFNRLILKCSQRDAASVDWSDTLYYSVVCSYTKVGIYKNDIKVIKEWDDDDDRDRLRSQNLKVTLCAKGEIDLKAWKTVDGGTLSSADKFNFDIYRQDVTSDADSGKVAFAGTAVNDTDGVIAINTLKFDQNDAGRTYLYYVCERAGDESSRFVFDLSVEKIELTDEEIDPSEIVKEPPGERTYEKNR